VVVRAKDIGPPKPISVTVQPQTVTLALGQTQQFTASVLNDISTAVFGIAFCWTALSDQYDLGRELTSVRARIVENYGGPALD